MKASTPPEPTLDSSVLVLKGVGPARAAALERLGVQTLRDLLLLRPRRLKRWEGRRSVAQALEAVGGEVSVLGELSPPSLYRRGRGRSVVRTKLTDATGTLDCYFFNQPWVFERLKECRSAGGPVELAGKVVSGRSGTTLATTKIGTPEAPLPGAGELTCVYPQVRGVGQLFLRRIAAEASARFGSALPEPLSPTELGEIGVPALSAAVLELHAPTDAERFARASERCLLEPLLALQARLARSRGRRQGSARAVPFPPGAWREVLARLPFEPTAGQRAILDELADDLVRSRPMRRLLQGDVGSGKTLVGLCAAYAVVAAGGQAAFMAPTEVLADQHFIGFRSLLESLSIRPVLLSAGRPAPERKRVLAELASGRAGLAFGTHALFSSGVHFRNLDLVVIDEQQRFGVAHKRALLEKGRDVHTLLMTATPIPRTLALTLYGDLEVSRLTESPPGRAGVRTRVRKPSERAQVIDFMARSLERGERAFWVCPRIGDSEERDGEEATVAAASGVYDEFARVPALARYGLELVHGGLSSEERAARIERFRRGVSRLCVCTTIIEVGVDVPEATVLAVEGAERFGLAQLHQLRGRVGRGSQRGWCILFDGSAQPGRLQFLEQESDGFAIAEEDLRRRGMGELDGLRQAGAGFEDPDDPERELELLLTAQKLVRSNPELARAYAAQREREPDLV